MKHPIIFCVALWALILSACATPTPTATPIPSPTAVPAADAADCTNLPANGPKIKIEGAWARGTESGMTASASASSTAMGMSSSSASGMGMMGIKTAIYMVIHNCAAQPDSLIKAASNVDPGTSLMNWELRDGKSVMFDVTQIDIPAGKKVELKSGGYHVMLNNLKKDLKPGDLVEVTLTFKNAGEIKLTPPVKIP